jgi:hypothetical protein
MTADKMCPLCLCWHTPLCRAVPRSTRWPVAPLERLAGGYKALERLAGGGNVARARRDGLTDRQSDQWATRCGYHPEVVWPGWAAAALRVVDEEAINGSRAVWLWRETQREAC